MNLTKQFPAWTQGHLVREAFWFASTLACGFMTLAILVQVPIDAATGHPWMTIIKVIACLQWSVWYRASLRKYRGER